MTITSDESSYTDQQLRRDRNFKIKTRSNSIEVSYIARVPGRRSKLDLYIETEKDDPSGSKIYIYIIGAVIGLLLVVIAILLCKFCPRLNCCLNCSCCKTSSEIFELSNIFDKFPETTYTPKKNKYNQNDCAICLCPFEENTQIRILECGHIFHGICIVTWFTKRNNDICPLCNKNLNEV